MRRALATGTLALAFTLAPATTTTTATAAARKPGAPTGSKGNNRSPGAGPEARRRASPAPEGTAKKSAAGKKPVAPARPRYPAMDVYAVNFKKALSLKLYDAKGQWQSKEARKLEEVLRCHHSGKRHRIARRVMELLYRVSRHYDGKRIELVAGFRARRFARTKGSNHIKGRAVDFRVAGVRNEALRDWVRKTFTKVGVGYYPNSSFVHLDVRDRNAYWVDNAGPGEAPRYGAETGNSRKAAAAEAGEGGGGESATVGDAAGANEPATPYAATPAPGGAPAAPSSAPETPSPPAAAPPTPAGDGASAGGETKADSRGDEDARRPLPIGGGPSFGLGN